MPPVSYPDFLGHSGTFMFYILEWSLSTPAMVAGNDRKISKI